MNDISLPKYNLKETISLDFDYGLTMAAGNPTDTDTTNNIIYGHNVTTVLKSTDGWLTTTVLTPDLTGIMNVRLLANNTLLVTTAGGKVYISNTAKTAFTLVLEFAAGYQLNYSNMDIRDGLILLSSYGLKGANPPRFAALSLDYGATWQGTIQKTVNGTVYNFIYEGPSTETDYHIHDCCYDPYTQTIWILQGDSVNMSSYVYSHNSGVTWNTFLAHRDTGIIALPDRMIIATDNDTPGIRQILKDPLNPNRTNYTVNDVDDVYIAPTFINWRMYQKVNQYPYDILIKGIGQASLDAFHAIYATPNGRDWCTVWDIRNQIQNADHAVGITAVCQNPDSNGWIYGAGVFTESGTVKQFRMKLPEWIAK